MRTFLFNIPDKLKTVLWGENWLDIFLYLLFFSFFLAPFIDSPPVRLLTSLLYSLLMIAGVVSMSRHTSIRFAAGMVAVRSHQPALAEAYHADSRR